VKATSADPNGGGANATSAATAVVTDPAPVLAITSTALTLPKGGAVALGVSVTGDSDDSVLVKITGLTGYESISDSLDGQSFKGGNGAIILSAAQVDSGLLLHSNYAGGLQPMNTLTLTASISAPGEKASAPPQAIKVTDPPAADTPSAAT
jgi:hypothetical protein